MKKSHFNYASQSRPDNLNGLPLFQKTTDKRLKIMQDICERKHGGNAESVAAFQSIKDKLTGMQLVVLSMIQRSGDRGMTCDDISKEMGRGENCYSGRITELLKAGKIKREGRRQTRSGCWASVLKAL